MVAIVKRIKGHYGVQEVEFGRVYRWCPEHVVVAECGCGERTSLIASSATNCRRCGTDLAVVFHDEPITERPGDETLRPWRYEVHREGAGLPC